MSDDKWVMPVLLAALAFFILAFAATSYAAEPEKGGLYNDPSKGSYQLWDGDNALCSGSFFRSDDKHDYFITAAHCYSKKRNLNIRVRKLDDEFKVTSEHIIYLEAKRVLKDLDVAVLQTKDPTAHTFHTVKIAEQADADAITFGERVIAIGYPRGREMTITDGLYTGPAKTEVGGLKQEFFRTTAHVIGGSSGGGIFMRSGLAWKLFGITSHGIPSAGFMNYFANTKSVLTVIKGLQEDDAPKPSAAGG